MKMHYHSLCVALGLLAQLFVVPPHAATAQEPPIIVKQPESRTNMPGSALQFQIQIDSSPPFVIHWQRSGTNLTNDLRVSGCNDLVLRIENAQCEDSGSYSALVSNAFGITPTAEAAGIVLPWKNRIVGWGTGPALPVPLILGNPVAVAASPGPAASNTGGHCLAVMSDGTVIGWGLNNAGQSSPPAGLTNVVAVVASDWFSLAACRT